MLAIQSKNSELVERILNAPIAANPFYLDCMGKDALAYADEENAKLMSS